MILIADMYILYARKSFRAHYYHYNWAKGKLRVYEIKIREKDSCIVVCPVVRTLYLGFTWVQYMNDHAVSHNCGSSLASLLIYHPFLYNILAIGSKYCFRRPNLNIIYLVKREPLATLQSSLNCSDLSLNSPTFHPSCASIRLAFQYSSYLCSTLPVQQLRLWKSPFLSSSAWASFLRMFLPVLTLGNTVY